MCVRARALSLNPVAVVVYKLFTVRVRRSGRVGELFLVKLEGFAKPECRLPSLLLQLLLRRPTRL